ncbi:DUF4157 domain-containing protein [Streptomyces sp. NPDC046727]|uniref:eCIS core domain-containing protein n=1 Tax=Streptomyces sp. NPDC046727 TaxID=3155373 RepID=UPI0033C7A804
MGGMVTVSRPAWSDDADDDGGEPAGRTTAVVRSDDRTRGVRDPQGEHQPRYGMERLGEVRRAVSHTSRAYHSAPKNGRTGAAKEQQAGDRAATHVHLRRSFGNQYLGALHDCRCQAAPRPACDTPEPLEPGLRSDLEGRFGTDLASIRLHAGPRADADARRLGADAFTTGQDIFFRSGRFAPATREGLRLLAHEVTHTIQQRQRGRARGPARYSTVSDPADPAELEAHLVADRLVRGVPVPPIGRGGRAGPTAAVLLSPASDTISRHTSWYGDLDERALGRELLNRARAGDFAFVQDTLDALGSTDRDDVAYEFCAAASDPDIVRMTTSAAGRAVIDRLFDELTEGSKDADEQRQADRLLRVKAARIRPEDFLTGVRAAKVFPFRAPGFTVLDDAPISAQRRPGGRIRVHMPNRVLGTAMFRAETRTLPVDTFIGGIELPENEIVGVRLYDLGGVLVYRPALILVELSNETTTTVLTKLAEAVGIGLTLGAGSLVGLGVEATMAARVLLWADRAAFVLGTLTSVIKEHRGEILARFGDTGREFLQYVDYVHSATAIYGFARVALSLGQLVNGLRTAYNNLRTAAGREGATGGLAGDLTANTEELLRKAEDIQGAKASAAPRGSRPGGTEPPTPRLPAAVEESPLAKVRAAEEFYPGHKGAVGTLEAPGRQPMRIKSGVDGGPWGGTHRGGIPRGRGEAFTSGGPSQGNIATHVEGHAAAIMHQQGLTEATLTMGIDQCTICGNNLPSALPPGAVLRVDHVAPSGQVYSTVYRSSHGR